MHVRDDIPYYDVTMAQVAIDQVFLKWTEAINTLETRGTASQRDVDILKECVKGFQTFTIILDGLLSEVSPKPPKLGLKEWLKEHGFRGVESYNNDEATPLTLASARGDVDIVRALLEKKVDVNKRTLSGTKVPAVTLAAIWGRYEILEMLLKAGANVNVTSGNGLTPLILASEEGRLEAIKLFLKHGADVNQTHSFGGNALNHAAYRGQADAIDVLVEAGSVLENGMGGTTTALSTAVSMNHTDAALALIRHGANVRTPGDNGELLTCSAAANDNVEILEALLGAGIDVNEQNPGTPRCLTGACFNRGTMHVVNRLIALGAEVDGDNGAAMIACCDSGNVEAALALIASKKVDVNLANPATGVTPIMLAYQFPKLVRVLLRAGANMFAKDRQGRSVLDRVNEPKYMESLKVLWEHGQKNKKTSK